MVVGKVDGIGMQNVESSKLQYEETSTTDDIPFSSVRSDEDYLPDLSLSGKLGLGGSSNELFFSASEPITPDTPFPTELYLQQNQEAKKNAFATVFSDELNSLTTDKGDVLDGSGVTIRILEPAEGEWGQQHARLVQKIAQEAAPGSNVEFTATSSDRQTTDPKPLYEHIQQQAKNYLLEAADDVEALISDDAPEKIINMSYGTTKYKIYENIKQTALDYADKPGNEYYRQFVYADDGRRLTENEQNKKVKDYVDKALEADKTGFDEAMNEWERVSKLAADKGIIITTAVGNDFKNAKDKYGATGDEALSFLAQSPYVISVAASDTQGTRSLEDDTLKPLSYNDNSVTIAAPSEAGFDEVLKKEGKPPNGVGDGTSISSPVVAAVIARMLQKDPNLTFDDVKRILQNTAKTAANDTSNDKVKILDPISAINAA